MSAIFTPEFSSSIRAQAPNTDSANVVRRTGEADHVATPRTNESPLVEVPLKSVVQSLKIGVMNIGVFALGAAVVSAVVLPSGMALLGFFVALSIMSFIGLPLILASIADASGSDGA